MAHESSISTGLHAYLEVSIEESEMTVEFALFASTRVHNVIGCIVLRYNAPVTGEIAFAMKLKLSLNR